MNLALDFDDTYTKDPELWHEVIRLAELRGHRVYVVTCRRDTPENREIVRVPTLPPYRHYFTGLAPKRWYMQQQGIEIDVWIDDLPESVREGR